MVVTNPDGANIQVTIFNTDINTARINSFTINWVPKSNSIAALSQIDIGSWHVTPDQTTPYTFSNSTGWDLPKPSIVVNFTFSHKLKSDATISFEINGKNCYLNAP
jgi:hypothetical protein